jgi:hypothetical protein
VGRGVRAAAAFMSELAAAARNVRPRTYAIIGVPAVVLTLIGWQRCGVSGCPSVDTLAAFQPEGAPVLLDSDGEPFAVLMPVQREVIPLESLPDTSGTYGRFAGSRCVAGAASPEGGPTYLQGAIVVMDAADGTCSPWSVAGISGSPASTAPWMRRQVGSTFKPFVFAAGLDRDYAPSQHACSGRKAWSIALTPSTGAFQNGSAAVTARTVGNAPGVLPSTAAGTVRLVWGRK